MPCHREQTVIPRLQPRDLPEKSPFASSGDPSLRAWGRGCSLGGCYACGAFTTKLKVAAIVPSPLSCTFITSDGLKIPSRLFVGSFGK
ncbi:MAG: hypothetical protein QOF51_2838 [Chloroflexota bacterium]|nr:hypothetical protein [Chloroflexota bacterium]